MEFVSDYLKGLQILLGNLPEEQIRRVIDLVYQARLANRQIFIMGNGGSASTASHFVCDLSKNTRREGWPNFRVIGLTDNMPLVTAFANDEGYDTVFAQQLASFIQPDDVVIGISASGNSKNVLNAIDFAHSRNALTVGFTGFDGGKLANMVDINVHVPSHNIQHVEDVHLALEHLITNALNELVKRADAILPPVYARLDQKTERIEFVTERSGDGLLVTANTPDRSQMLTMVQLLQSIQSDLSHVQDSREFLERLLSLSLEGIGAASGSIVVLDAEGQPFSGFLAYDGRIQEYAAAQFNEIVKHGLAGWVVQNREAALVENISDDPRWLPRRWEGQIVPNRSAISVPLTDHNQVIGAMTLVSPESRQFTLEDMAMLTALSVTVSHIKSKPNLMSGNDSLVVAGD